MPLFDITMAFHASNGLLVINIFNVYQCWSDSDQTLKSTRGEGSIDIIQLHQHIVSHWVLISDTNQCVEEIPNMFIRAPCLSGHSCHFDCNEGFHRHPMALDSLECADGKLYLHTTKYDHSITPQTVCVPDG